MIENYKENKDIVASEEVDLFIFINLILRNKFFIFSTTFIVTIIGIIYSYFIKPVYQGSFELVISQISQQRNTNNQLSSIFPNAFDNKNFYTQKLILESPSVIKSIYDKTLKNYQKRKDPVLSNISFKYWAKETLKLEFQPGTDVLEVSFKDKDKKLILETLDLLSIEYQNHISKIKNEELNNTIQFLENQKKIYSKKSKESLKELNKFSIENGLGDIDGFVSLGERNSLEEFIVNDQLFNQGFTPKINNISTNSNAGQRFAKQFQLLERYESEYTNYSAKLKPNSKFLRELKSKIENLRSSLKRPNEILIRHKELTKIAQRDENLINDIEKSLIQNKLELAKKKKPWTLISAPYIDPIRVSPNRTLITLITFIGTFLVSLMISLIREKNSNLIYELSELQLKIKALFIETIYLKNPNLSMKIITSSINKIAALSKKTKQNIGIIAYPDSNLNNEVKSILKDNLNYEIIDINSENTNNFETIFFIISNKKITNQNIVFLNKYINIYSEKIMGWFYLDIENII